MKTVLYSILICLLFINCKSEQKEKYPYNNVNTTLPNNKLIEKQKDSISIIPIEHASTILEYKGKTIYIDPTGGTKAYKSKKPANLVLITDIHGDHMDIATLDSLNIAQGVIVVPQAVADKLPSSYMEQLVIINNGETKNIQGITIEAIPMYNLREEALKFHNKGRGNGYVITLGTKRIYFSGDTEDIPEMRALKKIDIAFICMNLPYTMTVESAADAVLEFKPKQVYPHHYRGTHGLSDVVKFKKLVSKDPDIKVIQLDWYPTPN